MDTVQAGEAIDIFTDGSARRQDLGGGWPGGFAFVVLYKSSRMERFGWANAASSNQMELSAILTALSILQTTGTDIRVISDSNYSIHALTQWYKGWERYGWTTATGQPVKNRELIQACREVIDRHQESGSGVRFHHVKGHSGVDENERADALASRARTMRICNIKTPLVLPGLDFHKHQPRRRKCPTIN